MKKILIIYGPMRSGKSRFIEAQPGFLKILGRYYCRTKVPKDLLYKIYMNYCATAFRANNNLQFICLDDVPVKQMNVVISRLMDYHKVHLLLPLVITVCCDEFTLPPGDSISERFELLNVADIPENGLPDWFNFPPTGLPELIKMYEGQLRDLQATNLDELNIPEHYEVENYISKLSSVIQDLKKVDTFSSTLYKHYSDFTE